MKELSIEQKARAYDEAIERANSLLSSNELGNAWIYKLLPELREPEDERIRKEIIEQINLLKSATLSDLKDKQFNSWIAWLEKQGKNKDILEDAVLDSNEDGLIAETIRYKNEKQGEKKPTDKDGPKFKAGDWIVFNGLTLQVKRVVKGYYITTSLDGITNGYDWSIDNAARLWTIQDAKDGDVLVLNNEVFIYAHRKQMYSIAVAHCFVDSAGSFYLDGEFGYKECGKTTSPATKEQRNLLFQKMKGAGYVWDTEDKQLKKIEQKHTPKHKVGDTIYYNSFGELKSMIVANVTTGGTDNPMYEDENGNAVFEKDLVEQKPAAWSEEDEIIRKSLINMVEKFYGSCNDKSARNRFTYWLNYLKNRIQPQSQWKPSDKDIFELQCVINNDPYNGFILKALLEQLKKLGKE
jgi:hypothetical protein